MGSKVKGVKKSNKPTRGKAPGGRVYEVAQAILSAPEGGVAAVIRAALNDKEAPIRRDPRAFTMFSTRCRKKGEWAKAYENLCVGNKIDEDEDSKELQKVLKAKVDKVRKINEARSKRADELFASLGLADAWAALEVDVLNRPDGGHGLEALKRWCTADVVTLKAKLGGLGATEEQMDAVLKALDALP